MNRLIKLKILLMAAIAIVSCFTSSAVAQLDGDGQASSPATHAALKAEHLYNGVNRPMMIQIGDRPSISEYSLVLLDSANQIVSGPVVVRAGRSDLSELMPEVWQLREAVYLQLLEYDRPTGAALVLQPMLTRMVPVTEQAVRAGGNYTTIIGWRSEMEPVPVVEVEDEVSGESIDTSKEGETGKRETVGNDDPAPSTTTSSPIDAAGSLSGVFSVGDQLLTGIRAYPERDVEMITTQGRVLLQMRADEAPNTVWNFLTLCEGGFYREVAFHRVVPMLRDGRPFVIQAGDPTATGEGGAGYWLPIEPSELPHEFGVISMARADDPDSAGSQFFICLSREGTARLDGQYCAFGMAMDGAETIRKIADTELADVEAGRPVRAPLIVETHLIAAPPRVPGVVRVPKWLQREEPARTPDKPRRVPR